MKKLILILALLGTGCATVDHNGDTPHQAEVRAWLTTEVTRIHEKRSVVDDMYATGEVTFHEYTLLIEACDEEKRTILQRLPEHLK